MPEITAVVKALYSESSACVCCQGRHVYAHRVEDEAGASLHLGDWVHRHYHGLAYGARIKVSVEVVFSGHRLGEIEEMREPTSAAWGDLIRFEQECACGWESGQCYPREVAERAGQNHLAAVRGEITT